MRIINKSTGTVVNTTATTAAYLVSEGYDVWATDAEWKRIHKAMRRLGLTDDTTNTISPADCGTEHCIERWWQDTLDEYPYGAVEALWEELEMLGLVPEWDYVEQCWED